MSVQIQQTQTQGDVDKETLAGLGATSTGPAFVLPPMTPGRAALLDLMDSPLLAGKPLSKRDLYTAGYIIDRGQEAVEPINRALRQVQCIQGASELAGQSTANFEAYLAALRGAAGDFGEFDRALMAWIEEKGLMPGDMDEQLRAAVETAYAGWTLIHGGTSAQKKSTPSTLSGSPAPIKKSAKSPPEQTGTTSSGACPSQYQAISTQSPVPSTGPTSPG